MTTKHQRVYLPISGYSDDVKREVTDAFERTIKPFECECEKGEHIGDYTNSITFDDGKKMEEHKRGSFLTADFNTKKGAFAAWNRLNENSVLQKYNVQCGLSLS